MKIKYYTSSIICPFVGHSITWLGVYLNALFSISTAVARYVYIISLCFYGYTVIDKIQLLSVRNLFYEKLNSIIILYSSL